MANTVNTSLELITDFNTSPYYDDFDANNNFYRILYRPGYAVQARELTQMQTSFQKQVSSFAEHVFKEGTLVKGGEFFFDDNYKYIKLRDNDKAGSNVSVTNFLNTQITGNTTNVSAIVVQTLDGTEDSANTKTLYIKYLTSSSNGTATKFGRGEEITSNTGYSANLISNTTATGVSSAFTIDTGVLYAKGFFIPFNKQTILLERYGYIGNISVGFLINEEIVTSDSDSSLLDPAQGAPNFAAPRREPLEVVCNLDLHEKRTVRKYGISEIICSVIYARHANRIAQIG